MNERALHEYVMKYKRPPIERRFRMHEPSRRFLDERALTHTRRDYFDGLIDAYEFEARLDELIRAGRYEP